MNSNKMALAQIRKKRNRFVMNLEQKINVLDRLARGEGPTSIGQLFNVNESTIRTIKRNEQSIRASVLYSSSTSVKVACIPRDHNIEKTEKILHIWITEQLQRNIPLTTLIIREKAKRLYNHFVQNSETTKQIGKKYKEFNASKGWFEKFKKRYELQYIKLAVESEPDSVIERLEAFDDMELSRIEDLLQTQEIEEEYKIDIIEEKPNISEILKQNIEIAEKDIATPEIKIETVKTAETVESVETVEIAKTVKTAEPVEETNKMPDEVFENVNIKSETYSDEDTEIMNKKSNNIDLHKLNQGIVMAYHLADHFTAIDPESDRSINFRQGLEKLLQPYQELQRQTINKLFKKE